MSRTLYHWGAIVSLIILTLMSVAWELWLAPIRPGGSFLAFKAVILLLPLRGVLSGRIYTYQWSSMFIMLPFTEGVMRGWADHGLARSLALAEVALSVAFFLAVLGYLSDIKRCQKLAQSASSSAK